MKDAVATMGSILPDDVGGRDAVHVAVISAKASVSLRPGQEVRFVKIGTEEAVADSIEPIGIVDPFLKNQVSRGQRFWLYLFPRTITSLRHNWTHPAFPNEQGGVYYTPTQKLDAEKWLRDFCAHNDCPDYDRMIEILNKIADGTTSDSFIDENEDCYGWNVDFDYLHFNGSDAYGVIPGTFWVMAEIVIGKPLKYKPTYFSCSC